MFTNTTSPAPRGRGRWIRLLRAVSLVMVAAGCSSLLDVENPNNVNQDNLNNPAAAAALANGALSATARALGNVLTPYSEATDELTWIGSRDAWDDLDKGYLTGITNEFVDAAFPQVAQSRWLSDEAIKRLGGFDADGKLADRNLLARSYLYGAIAYTMIGDMFNDFPIGSDRTVEAAPLGPANMAQVYDTAVVYATRGIAIAQATGDAELERELTAMRARARHAQGVWQKLNPFSPATLASPLVNDPAAVADATAALAGAAADWKYQFNYSSETVSTGIGFEVNQRLESRFGDLYIVPTTDNKRVASIRLLDAINNKPDPVLSRTINEFVAGVQYGPLTVVSSRELYLILAEARLAQNDSVGAATFINNIRALVAADSLTPYDPLNAAHPRALAMLQHERRVNLFLQGRRLADHYRFGVPADKWPANAEAVQQPGTVFPITNTEILANCHIQGTC
ncbi:MAG TPA: RagB/SusD family nutrient uptake outer membrane protein [Vicinamibacterales bacterium]|nr:RagB/SusD family nutrient uptake outer membrane protein [Vicinamibacterales bacterium]